MKTIGKKPDWLKIKAISGKTYNQVHTLLEMYNLQTVCQAANCPNRGECFDRGTATFLILGPKCTRNCRFCDIEPGKTSAVDPSEPERIAELSKELKLNHVVITSVTRDDLPDGGASQFAACISELRKSLPNSTVEILTPDFKGQPDARKIILEAKPDIFNHNLETVPSLYSKVRPQADYKLSLDLLKYIYDNSQILTKSGIMVGVGETLDELCQLFEDLCSVNVSILTIGQYLAPSKMHLAVEKYYHPDEFEMLKEKAEQAGIKNVFSAPLVRSSYKADLVL
ncbi:MAG: lipoyl synthase [Calditrichaeota bacterium]|nr:MAG: lipoyl synthase [Calditrichota bacterium]